MTWTQARLTAWLDHVEPALDRLTPFELLEIPPTASGDHVQRAFHEIAGTRHPDLWRNRVTARELERVVRVYGRVSAAYTTLRDAEQRTRVLRDLRAGRDSRPGSIAADERDRPAGGPRPAPTTPPERLARPTVPTEPPPVPGIARSGQAGSGPHLGARALGFYRRAEAALRLGDVAGAILNLRMAIAAEPASSFLRERLAEAQARLQR